MSNPVSRPRRRDCAGQAEVGDLHPPVVAREHVLRLHVTVHDARGMRGGQRGKHRLEYVESLEGAQPPAGPQQVAQRAPGDVLHDEEDRGTVGALVEDGDYVGCARAAPSTSPRG
jgi:hypothetical protein